MKLILHIGTHKTGTTSIQHCCALNRASLLKYGIYYPRPMMSSYEFNDLANKIAKGREAEVSSFIGKIYKKAKEYNSEYVIISGESFYSMTGFFCMLLDRFQDNSDFWKNEDILIGKLKAVLAPFQDISILMTVRPQEEFASSLYNQSVKNVNRIPSSYEEFVIKISKILDYQKHVELWKKHFGGDNIEVEMMCKGDVVENFLKKFLDESQIQELSWKVFNSNQRLSRDVLEYKRILDVTKWDKPYAFVASRILRDICNIFPDQEGYQIFSTDDFYRNFYNQFDEGNAVLGRAYGIDDLFSWKKKGLSTYQGLESGKKNEIDHVFLRRMNSPSIRIEIFARRSLRKVASSGDISRKAVNLIRRINNIMRLRFSGW